MKIVVIGTSAGGMEALTELVALLPRTLAASIFVVQHNAPDSDTRVLQRVLSRAGPLPCEQAAHGARFKTGHIYLAQPDHHLMLGKQKMVLTRGARENRFRPAIDPLFRSAAVTYRSRVVGIVLSGYLDDGTAGMIAIQRCGGVTIVQDPLDAAYPDMPQNVINQLAPDHVVPLAQMGALLTTLTKKPAGRNPPIPRDVIVEAKIAERVLSDLPSVEAVGTQVPFNCPGCGGVLWEVEKGPVLRYRCHTGHAYTSASLLAEQTEKIEETLWVALRMFEERRNLLATVSNKHSRGYLPTAASRVDESDVHIQRLRAMLTHDEPQAGKRRRP